MFHIDTKTTIVGTGAAVTGVSAAILVYVSHAIFSAKNVQMADKIIREDTWNNDGFSMVNVEDVMHLVYCFAIAGVVAGVMGVYGAYSHTRWILSCYSLYSLIGFFLSVAAALGMLTLIEAVEPTIRRQLIEWCDPQDYVQTKFNLAMRAEAWGRFPDRDYCLDSAGDQDAAVQRAPTDALHYLTPSVFAQMKAKKEAEADGFIKKKAESENVRRTPNRAEPQPTAESGSFWSW